MTMEPATDRQRGPHRGSLVGGILLVVVGLAFLVGRVIDVRFGADVWPLFIVAPGIAMFIAAFAIGGRAGLGLAIPGAIVTTVGLLLWVQEATGTYQTWAYAWALVAPGSVGLGMLVYGLFLGDRTVAGDGLRTFLVGLGLFLGFALFFEGMIGLSGPRLAGLDEILPVAVIILGALLVVLGLFGRRGRIA
jgi:hypothetical protein